MTRPDPPPLRLRALHERHFGVTEEIGRLYEQAAAVCLSRHHASPALLSVSRDEGPVRQYLTEWIPPTLRQRSAWANTDDATTHGAYGVALAALEADVGMVALCRAETKSGADYYVGSPGTSLDPDIGTLSLEAAIRLEISGIGFDERTAILRDRVREKVEQVRRAASNYPAMVGVVAFRLIRVVFQRL